MTSSLVVVVALSILILSWSIASPPGSTPDENYHIGNAWCAFGESKNCSITEATEGGYRRAEIPFTVDLCFNRGPEIPASCISENPPNSQFVPIDSLSSLYPPQFYLVGGAFLQTFGENGILTFRLFNGLLFVVLVSLALGVAPRLVRNALLGSLFAFLVPQGIYLVASVNPSSWSFSGVVTTWVFILSFLVHLRNKERLLSYLAFLGWILSILVSSARFDSLIYATFLSVAAAILGSFWHLKIRKAFLVGLVACCFAAVVATDGLMRSVLDRTVDMVKAPQFFSFARYWLIHFLEIPFTSIGLNYGSYGPTGSLDVLTPPLVGHIQFAFLAAGLFWSLRERVKRQRIFLSTFLLLLYVVILQEVSQYHETGFYFVQGRYFLPFIAGSIGIVIATSSSDKSLLDFPALRSLFVGLASISHSLALFAIVRRYSYGTTNDYKRFEIDVDKNFSLPDGWRYVSFLSPRAVLIGGSIAFAIATWMIVTMLNTDDEPDKPSERLVQET